MSEFPQHHTSYILLLGTPLRVLTRVGLIVKKGHRYTTYDPPATIGQPIIITQSTTWTA